MTAVPLRRITVQSEQNGRPVAVDVAVPSHSTPGEMLPFVVETVVDEPLVDAGPDGYWVLTRSSGGPLDESMTLHDSDVHDGDILLLTFVESTFHLPQVDPCRSVMEASPPSRDGSTSRRVGAIVCMWTMAASAASLVFGAGPPTVRSIIAGLVALIAAVGSVAADRLDAGAATTVVMGAITLIFAGIAAFLVVPGGPAPPNAFLAAAVCATIAIALLHVTPHGTSWFVAIASLSTTVSVVAAITAFWSVPMAVAGTVLATGALALVGSAARLAIFLSGLSPFAEIDSATAQRGHEVLGGLLAGFSASTALGVVLVAVGQYQSRALSGMCFTAAVSVTLLLRARLHRVAARMAVNVVSGMVCASAAFVLIVGTHTDHAQWASLISAAIGMVVIWLPFATAGRRNPVLLRGFELLDYLALASVVPLACWVAGVFGIARGLSLT
jgi:type VII secretion integral membrane protein EccD